MKTCFTLPDADIKLEQSEGGKKLFRVTYGLQVMSDLTYVRAAHELGECILHHLCCESLAENDGV